MARMTVGQLKRFLSELEDDNVEVCLSSDDGRDYFPVDKIGTALALPQAAGHYTRFSEEVKDLLPDTERVFYFKVDEE